MGEEKINREDEAWKMMAFLRGEITALRADKQAAIEAAGTSRHNAYLMSHYREAFNGLREVVRIIMDSGRVTIVDGERRVMVDEKVWISAMESIRQVEERLNNA